MYLDSAATTKPDKEVIKAMMPYLETEWHNPSSLYSPAQKVRNDIDEVRMITANYINANSNEIYFTSGGSESNCWAIQGFIQNRIAHGRVPSVITTLIEHKSILSCVANISVDVHYVPVDNHGFVNLELLENTLQYIAEQTDDGEDILVSIQFANNEIGTIQNIQRITKIVHKYGAIFHTDAVQAFGQIHIDVEAMGIDMLSASGHKIHTPKGIGILYKKDSVRINPLIYGSQENEMRGGTENVPYIIGFGKAVELLQQKEQEVVMIKSSFNDICDDIMTRKDQMIEWRNKFIYELKSIGCNINGDLLNRLPNNINITFPQKATGEAIIYMLDMGEIYVSAGSACNSHSQSISHVLKAIGLSENEALRTIRITLSDTVPYEERDNVTKTFISEFKKQLKLLDISE